MKYLTLVACLAVSALSLSACGTRDQNDSGYTSSRTAGGVNTVFSDSASSGAVFNDKMSK